MTAKKIVGKLSTLMLVLLVVGAGLYVLTALKYLQDDPLVGALPYMQVAGGARALLVLAALVGMVAAVWKNYGDNDFTDHFGWLGIVWQVMGALALLAVALNMLEGRVWLELPPLLDSLLFPLFIASLMPFYEELFEDLTLLLVLLLVASCLFAGAMAPRHPIQDIITQLLASGVLIQAALPVTVLLVLGHNRGAAASLLFASAYSALAPMFIYSEGTFETLLTVLVLGSAMAYLMFFIFGMSGSDRIVHGFFALNLLIGLAYVFAGDYIHGTALSTLQMLLPLSGTLLLLIGGLFPSVRANQMIYPMLIVGTVIGGVLLAVIGIVQVYLERVFSIGYLNVQTALVPLYELWIYAVFLLLVGVVLIGVLRFIERN